MRAFVFAKAESGWNRRALRLPQSWGRRFLFVEHRENFSEISKTIFIL